MCVVLKALMTSFVLSTILKGSVGLILAKTFTKPYTNLQGYNMGIYSKYFTSRGGKPQRPIEQ
jgi:hypothetical protein